MPKLAKAFPIDKLRTYEDWYPLSNDDEMGLSNGEVVYLLEDFRVTVNPLTPDAEEYLVVTQVTPAWESFCRQSLAFGQD